MFLACVGEEIDRRSGKGGCITWENCASGTVLQKGSCELDLGPNHIAVGTPHFIHLGRYAPEGCNHVKSAEHLGEVIDRLVELVEKFAVDHPLLFAPESNKSKSKKPTADAPPTPPPNTINPIFQVEDDIGGGVGNTGDGKRKMWIVAKDARYTSEMNELIDLVLTLAAAVEAESGNRVKVYVISLLISVAGANEQSAHADDQVEVTCKEAYHTNPCYSYIFAGSKNASLNVWEGLDEVESMIKEQEYYTTDKPTVLAAIKKNSFGKDRFEKPSTPFLSDVLSSSRRLLFMEGLRTRPMPTITGYTSTSDPRGLQARMTQEQVLGKPINYVVGMLVSCPPRRWMNSTQYFTTTRRCGMRS